MDFELWHSAKQAWQALSGRFRMLLALAGLFLALAAIAVVTRADSGGQPLTEVKAEAAAPVLEPPPPIATVAAVAVKPRITTPAPVASLPAAPAVDTAPAPVAPVAAAPVVVIDPGHAARGDSGVEPIGPGSSQMKVKDPGGTSGVASGVREAEVTLAIAGYLRERLEAAGITVVMTREGAQYSGGNRERAAVANQAGAALAVRIHCDGSANAAASGASTLYPALIAGWTDDIYTESKRAAGLVQAALVGRLGVGDRGLVERSDITGFNWSDTPVILTEVGFMSNAEEDLKLNTPAYRQAVAGALFEGIMGFLR